MKILHGKASTVQLKTTSEMQTKKKKKKNQERKNRKKLQFVLFFDWFWFGLVYEMHHEIDA